MFQMGGGKPPPSRPEPKPRAERKPARVKVTVELEPRQRDKLAVLGGDAWLRERIDEARVPVVER